MKQFQIRLQATVSFLMISLCTASGIYSACQAAGTCEESSSSGYSSSQMETTFDKQSPPSFFYPPYQLSLDNPVQLQFFSTNAKKVVVSVANKTSGKRFDYPLTYSSKTKAWESKIPPSDFGRSHELAITFSPLNEAGQVMEEQVQTTVHITLNTPDSYKAAAAKDGEVKVVTFQQQVSSGPVFNVYWPKLYYDNKRPYARVTASRAPESSVQKLDPIKAKPGWFQLQVSSLWFTPGEVVTVDFTSKEIKQETNEEFVPQETVQFHTLSRS